jgi:hypothetical protein
LGGQDNLLETIHSAWGWMGLEPAEILATNPFGNVIFKGVDGSYWRICPEELTAARLASSNDEFVRVTADEQFTEDWEALVSLAVAALGEVEAGRCYCLKIPAVLGGAYGPENLGQISIGELLAFTGHLAEQIKDLPDGAAVKLTVG